MIGNKFVINKLLFDIYEVNKQPKYRGAMGPLVCRFVNVMIRKTITIVISFLFNYHMLVCIFANNNSNINSFKLHL